MENAGPTTAPPFQEPSPGKRPFRLVVAGQLPPPVTGQNIMVERNLRLLREQTGWTVDHLPLNFTRSMGEFRRVTPHKLVALVDVWRALRALRRAGRIDALLFPIGGPHLVPILRDLILLPLLQRHARAVILHIHAAGIAEKLPTLPAPVRAAYRHACHGLAGAISLTRYGLRDPEALGIAHALACPNAVEDRYREDLRPTHADDAIRVIQVGYLCEEKGTLPLLEAAAKLRDKHPRLRLHLVGAVKPPLTETALRARIQELGIAGIVDLPGVLRGEELDRAYAQAHLGAFPSVAAVEAFPLSLCEMLMWGLPVVVPQRRGYGEILGDPPGGIHFPLPTDEAIRATLPDALDALLSRQEEWSAWSARNRRRFEEFLRPEAAGPLLAAAIANLARRPAHA